VNPAVARPVALITGAAGGMGVACAHALAPRAALILTDRDAARLGEVAAELAERFDRAPEVVPCDLGRPGALEDMVGRLEPRGRIRWVIHTAGLSPTMAGWREVLEVDLVATARLLEHLAPWMPPGGAAVCIASIAGHMGHDDGSIDAVLDAPLAPDLPGRLSTALGAEPDPGIAYLYAKRGVIRLCARKAVDWGKRGLRLVSVSPGLMDTSMGRLELIESPGKEPLIELTPLVRPRVDGQSRLPGRADDIARAVAFLCSDEASFVTGCDLRVDGGLIAALDVARS